MATHRTTHLPAFSLQGLRSRLSTNHPNPPSSEHLERTSSTSSCKTLPNRLPFRLRFDRLVPSRNPVIPHRLHLSFANETTILPITGKAGPNVHRSQDASHDLDDVLGAWSVHAADRLQVSSALEPPKRCGGKAGRKWAPSTQTRRAGHDSATVSQKLWTDGEQQVGFLQQKQQICIDDGDEERWGWLMMRHAVPEYILGIYADGSLQKRSQ